MSDETHPAPAARDAIALFLDSLVPPDGQQIEDLQGNPYDLPSALSARQQIQAGRHVQKLLGKVSAGGDTKAMIASAIDAAMADDATLDALDGAFTTALPGVWRQALEKAGATDAKPSDLFALEEMVAALVPYLLRAGRRILTATGADKALAAFAAA